ncbi:hypothetical protein H8356DRAFT_931058 [Neocallimastix lanati (nom. inval.)]|uniref:Uncharacterized protein n=1 Tax=Neocallimastix californiae TaxID=1754190 RepID=A0A1Y2FCJ5_9FUNG|nr:hypothetical protein H8356DRAFT_931058 [Neocallimastix sp. JGI-2020a]ORY81650.1 hypothetical protein LY90DRAFT_500036 [Neocallimastix californiae]|eukprot:ORY81650.1 hypothetical protein LY90DRAFT_500036 [Neocallimastix californiae]
MENQENNNEPESIVNNDDNSRKDINENSYSNKIQSQEEQEIFYYDELDRKCTLKRGGTSGSKIILYRARTHYKGKRIFDIATALLGIIGIILLIIFIIINVRRGWSRSDIYDVNSGKRVGIGLLGSYTYWKPIILMITLLSVLAFISHCYVTKQFLDIRRFAERDMAIPWWDTYSDETIMAIEEEFNCCGYLNYKDHGFASKNCPKDLVVYTVPADVYKAANVIKNDTYKRKYWKSNNGIAGTGTTANTTGETGNTGNDNNNDEGGEDNMEKRSINILNDNLSNEIMDKVGEELKSSINNGKGKISMNSTNKIKRQGPETESTTTATNIEGCQKAIADKVKSGITPLSIILFIFLIVYVVIFVSSFIYWLDLRNEKEYDEFS